jgi:hypothetical protein
MKKIVYIFSRLVPTLFMLVTLSGCVSYWEGVGGRIARGETGFLQI